VLIAHRRIFHLELRLLDGLSNSDPHRRSMLGNVLGLLVSLPGMGSFDCVRLAPHSAQDDKQENWKGEGENWQSTAET
jgi:hypothetical protein